MKTSPLQAAPALAALLLAVGACLPALAQTAAAPAASPQKKALIAKVLELQRPAIELMARAMAEQPAQQLLQAAAPVLQRLPQERREVIAREIEADARKYAEEVVPLVRDRALKAAPQSMGAVLEERMDEAELRQLVAALDSPGFKKYQSIGNELQRSLLQRVLADSKDQVEPKVKALEASIRQRLMPPAAPASGPAPAKN
jgi:hypothetical protein